MFLQNVHNNHSIVSQSLCLSVSVCVSLSQSVYLCQCVCVLALDLEGVHDLKLHHPSSSVATSNQ